MKFATVAALAPFLAPASAYAITGSTVNCRSGPGTSYGVKKSYTKGQDVTISCQTTGTSVDGNNIWDQTQDGCYVADSYVKTGTTGYVTTKCSINTCTVPKVNSATVDLIAASEGFRASVYLDAVGKETVGYGHLCAKSGCAEVTYAIPLSAANGKKLLADDVTKYEKCVAQYANSKAKLNANQYGALVSFTFNLGCGALQTSTLLKRLNNGEAPNTVIAEEFPKWVNGGGKPLPGLVTRRNKEIALAKTATTVAALPAC